MRAALIFAALCLAAPAASAQMYQWTDQNGRTHITGTPPPPGAKNVKKLGGGGAAPGTPAADEGGGNEPYTLQQARKNYPVTLYTAPDCNACDNARKHLNGRGVPFKEVSVRDNEAIEALEKLAGAPTVPVMVVGASIQKGYEETLFNNMLDAAGYPKTGVLPPRHQAEPAAPAAKPGAVVKPVAAEPEQPRGPYSPPPNPGAKDPGEARGAYSPSPYTEPKKK